MVAEVEEELPGTLAHLAYADEGGSEVTIVHIFPNPEAMGPHMKKAAVMPSAPPAVPIARP